MEAPKGAFFLPLDQIFSIFIIRMGQDITKKQLRRTILDYRKLLSQEEYEKRNNLLLDKISDHVAKSDPKAIHTFLPIVKNKEPDVRPLFESWWKNDIQLITSKTDFDSHEMIHFNLTQDTELVENNLGIPEPTGAQPIDHFEPDLVFVPLLAADRHLNRVGYGGGYYDQLLSSSSASKIGISLNSPMDEITQKNDWDIKLDVLITPFGRY
ncbi:MAG: 5-formyltetrahydrofolate cyclo-ligase [Bacteroidota bacterium]